MQDPPKEGIAENDEEDVENIFTDNPILLSQFLELKLIINDTIIKNFRQRATSIVSQTKRNKKDSDRLDDYILHHDRLIKNVEEDDESKPHTQSQSECKTPDKGSRNVHKETKAIKLNELVK